MPAAIATIAVKGPAAVQSVMSIVQLRVTDLRIGRVHYGAVALTNAAANADQANFPCEQVVVCRTTDEEVEVHCHGGPAVCQALLELLACQGCELVDSADWPTAAACPIAAAAERDLIEASTDKVAGVLVDQLGGALRRSLESIQQWIVRRELGRALSRLEELWRWRELGLHLSVPWKVVFAGPPNVGKSSLMNAIVGQCKSLVHDEPGTTRDWIDAEIALAGWPVTLLDTAGIRRGQDAVEDEGVRRSTELVTQADLVVFVVDAHVGWTQTHEQLWQHGVPRALVAWNKADLVPVPPDDLRARGCVVPSSTVQPPGCELLVNKLAEILVPDEPDVGQALPFRAAQVNRMEVAMELLRSQQAEAALKQLQIITTSWIEEQESP